MPLYEYRCKQCGHVFEKIQSFSAPDWKQCPRCAGEVERLISAPAIQFKGSGFYLTDYGKTGGAGKGSGAGDSGGAAGDSKGAGETKSLEKAASGASTSSTSAAAPSAGGGSASSQGPAPSSSASSGGGAKPN